MYQNGLGVKQDNKVALKWYTLAAKQGHPGAQYKLGFIKENGEVVIQAWTHFVCNLNNFKHVVDGSIWADESSTIFYGIENEISTLEIKIRYMQKEIRIHDLLGRQAHKVGEKMIVLYPVSPSWTLTGFLLNRRIHNRLV